MFTFPVAHFGGELSFTIAQSLRFNDDDSSFLNKTFGSAGNRKTYTFSGWFKRGNILGANTTLALAVEAGGNNADIHIQSDEKLRFRDQGNGLNLITNQVFRDPGAWFHIVASVDTTQSTASNRAKLYLNGSQITSFSTESYMSQNSEGLINSADNVEIGRNPNGSVFWDGYMSQIAFVDGQALGPTSFGETDSDTGQWKPIDITGLTFGSNGYLLQGQDSSALGDDTSGNGNDFTSNLTSADSVSDTPTDNQATLNPLFSGVTLSDGNLVATATGNSYQRAFSTIAIDDGGKYACEFQKSSGTFGLVGIMQNGNHTNTTGNSNMFGINLGNGEVFKGNPTASVLTTLTAPANSLMRIEYDSAADTIKIFDDGTEIFPASTGVSNTVGLTGHDSLHFGCAPYASGTAITATFSPLSGTPTTDFKELTAANLPDLTIVPSDYFNTVLYTGNGSTGQSITGVGFQPDFTWTKIRSPNAYSHQLFDAVRGAGKNLQTNNNNAEGDLTSEFTSFDSDGFTIDDVAQNVNENSSLYVAWNWKANGSGGSNDAGDITSTVSANTTSGFSIVTYSGSGSSGDTVAHGLGVKPSVVIVKPRNAADHWIVNDWSGDYSNKLKLNETEAASSSSGFVTAASSSTFTLGSDVSVNGSSRTYVAYCFAEVPGFSKFGSYTGSGSSDGVFVHTGFEVGFLMYKRTNSAESWEMYDNTRGFNVHNFNLRANLSNAEQSDVRVDLLSNGFKARSSNTAINSSGDSYIYMAFASRSFKSANAQ